MKKPELIINNKDKFVWKDISDYINYLKKNNDSPLELSICTAFFNMQGFNLLSNELKKVDKVRLLIGVEPDPYETKIRNLDKNENKLQNSLEGQLNSIKEDRNIFGFTLNNDKECKKLISWINSGKVEVRRHIKGFLHGKAWIIKSNDNSAIVGSSNFTKAGMSTNLELNTGIHNPLLVSEINNWYEKIWEDSEFFDLSYFYKEKFEEHSPYLIYLKMLYERYKNEFLDNISKDNILGLTGFQYDGVLRAEKILEKNNGVIIADGVGLGKSFIAGQLIRNSAHDLRQKVLLISPASLRDGMWRSWKENYATDFNFTSISYEQLSNDPQLGGKGRSVLSNINEYSLVIIDEAHAYRNPSTERSNTLRKLLEGSPPKKLILLTATPVNNSLKDLYFILSFFIKNDSHFIDQGIVSMTDHFNMISSENPDNLTPSLLFDILDEISVRRTRHFIKKHYPNELVPAPGGGNILINFPKSHVKKVSYKIGKALPGFFEKLDLALNVDLRDNISFKVPEKFYGQVLTLARYIPSTYLKNEDTDQQEVQVSGLLLASLLKRFESSSFSFIKTCEKMIEKNIIFLDGLSKNFILKGDLLNDWANTDSDEIEEIFDKVEETLDGNLYDISKLKKAVEADNSLLNSLIKDVQKITQFKDPKLVSLKKEIIDILDESKRESKSFEDEEDNKKLIIFTYFSDTANYIYEYLNKITNQKNSVLSEYKGRIGLVTGNTKNYEAFVWGFAPQSSGSPSNENKYDILVSTDVLAEGVNLQQSKHLINFDLPWNPMKLVQRNGRIDRIGSKHPSTFARCFFPDEELDDFLGLIKRILIKLKSASIAIGIENEVIPGSWTSDNNFSDTEKEIKRLRNEDSTLLEDGGELDGNYSGEELRKDLEEGLSNSLYKEKIIQLPWGSGSGKIVTGKEKGYIFCIKIGNSSKTHFRYISGDKFENIERNTLNCLSVVYSVESTERVMNDEVYKNAFEAWAKAKEDVYEKWNFFTEPKNLQSRIPSALRESIQILQENPPDNISKDELRTFQNCLSGNYPRRIWIEFRKLHNTIDNKKELSKSIIELVNKYGLEPNKAPKAFPKISFEDINLICWLAITN